MYHSTSCGKWLAVTYSCIGLRMSMAYLFSQNRTILISLLFLVVYFFLLFSLAYTSRFCVIRSMYDCMMAFT